MKTILRNPTYTDTRTHDCLIVRIGNKMNGGRIAKLTYEAYNGVEKYNTELFDGNKWNHIFSLMDMGTVPDTSAYSWHKNKRIERANDLFQIAQGMLLNLLD